MRKTRQTRPLSWQSNKLREVNPPSPQPPPPPPKKKQKKTPLDQTFVNKVASYKQKQMIMVVRRGQETSDRARPSTSPKWTYKQ